MYFYDRRIIWCLESLINWIFGEGMRSSLCLEGLGKINLVGAGAAGLQGEGAGVSTR